jgi:hypothetical protein
MGSKNVASENPDGIPEYLKQRPQWIVWGKRTKPFQNALLDNGKLNRIPFNPRTGKVAILFQKSFVLGKNLPALPNLAGFARNFSGQL